MYIKKKYIDSTKQRYIFGCIVLDSREKNEKLISLKSNFDTEMLVYMELTKLNRKTS